MKLRFKKDENKQISVVQLKDGEEIDFSYIEMIKSLIASRNMEEPEILEGFTEAEVNSIKSMVKHINKEISEPEES